MNIAAIAVAVDHLANKQRTTVTKLRRKPAKLMSRVGLCQRTGTIGQPAAGKKGSTFSAVQFIRIQPQFGRKLPVQLHDCRIRNLVPLPGRIEPFQFNRIAVVEIDFLLNCLVPS